MGQVNRSKAQQRRARFVDKVGDEEMLKECEEQLKRRGTFLAGAQGANPDLPGPIRSLGHSMSLDPDIGLCETRSAS